MYPIGKSYGEYSCDTELNVSHVNVSTVGADSSKETNIVDDLRLVLGRFPKIHLLVLDAIVHHLKESVGQILFTACSSLTCWTLLLV